MTFKPLPGKIIVKPLDAEESAGESGILLSSDVGGAVLRGEVIAVGADTVLNVGDIVLHGRYGFDEIRDGTQLLYVMGEGMVFTAVE